MTITLSYQSLNQHKISSRTGKNTVAIVGMAETTRDQAPWDDQDTEIWLMNESYMIPNFIRRADRWFQMHPRSNFSRTNNENDPDHYAWLQKEHEFPIYMQHKYKEIPSAVRYPLEEVVQLTGRRYFQSTVAFMIALAILEGFERIELYGVEMASNTEYCLGPDMRVLMSDLRWVPASALRVGDEIIAFDENPTKKKRARQWRTAVVEAVDVIQRPRSELQLSDGTVLVCSDEHRWFTGNANEYAWMETSKITPKYGRTRKGGHPTRLFRALPVWDFDSSYESGYVAGMFDGEGNLTQPEHAGHDWHHVILGLAQKENEAFRKAMQKLSKDGFVFADYSGDDVHKMQCRGGVPEVLRCLGVYRPSRLLPKLSVGRLGALRKLDAPQVLQKVSLGVGDVIALKTSTGTCIVEGIASHNSYQRSNGEYIMGFAIGRGIDLYIPEECTLLRGSLYGYEKFGLGFRQQLETRLNLLKMDKQTAMRAAANAEGAKAILDQQLATNADFSVVAMKQTRDELDKAYLTNVAMMNSIGGQMAECVTVIKMYDEYPFEQDTGDLDYEEE